MTSRMPPLPVGIFKFMQIFAHVINTQGTKLGFQDFIKNMFKYGLRLDIYEPVSSKLGMMIDTTKLSIVVPV